jgi:hypothetical protein
MVIGLDYCISGLVQEAPYSKPRLDKQPFRVELTWVSSQGLSILAFFEVLDYLEWMNGLGDQFEFEALSLTLQQNLRDAGLP